MKVLLAVDGSVYTKRMLAHLAAHEELLGRGHEYTAFTAVPPVPPAPRIISRMVGLSKGGVGLSGRGCYNHARIGDSRSA